MLNSSEVSGNIADLKGTLALCLTDLKVCCGTLFPEIFYSPFSTLHNQMFELINSESKKVALAAPRGIGKTSIARAVVMRAVLFRTHNFIVYLSNSATSAEMQTENIKRDLLSSELIQHLFGSVKEGISSASGTIIDESFSKKSWTAFGSALILPRGAGQQVRGLNWNNHRPDLIIVDDLENKDEITSIENRKKLKNWFYSDLLKTESRYSEKGTEIIYIDTIKHEDSLLQDLIESPVWSSTILSICDSNYKSLDTNYMTDEEIAEEVEEHRRLGTLDAFYMERMNIPISSEDAVFKAEDFRYFTDNFDSLGFMDSAKVQHSINTYNLIHVTLVDPARTVKLNSADSAIMTVAVDRTSRKLFVRSTTSEKFYPDQLYDELFRQVKLYNSFILGLDTIGLSNFVLQPLQSECRIRNAFPTIIELPAKKSKEERVATLAPMYRGHFIYHNKDICGKLETQLLSFPRSKLWDLMDCLAYITYVLDKYAIYFDPTDDPYEEIVDEYAELLNDKMLSSKEMGHLV